MASDKVGMENLVTFLLTALCFFCQTSNCQDYSSCGLRSVRRGKIFGGLQSRPGMWPWQVAIFRKNSDEDQKPQFFCGGALINSRWVLSAAHCFHKRQNEKYVHYRYTIKAGDHKIYSKDPYEQERDARIHNHPNFIPSTFENDVALVELDKGVKMGPNVRSICLPKANENLSSPGEIVSVAGWGYTTKGSHSSVLLHSAFEIQNNKNCKDTTTYEFNKTVMFCAGHGKGGNDTCKGDSGGSTVREVLRDGRRRWVTVGLVSWGEGCGIKGKYGYYTRVEPFVDWIQKKINGSILSCGDPGNIPNGRINGTDFLVGFTVKYKCNEGYRLRGRSKSRCKRNGKWTKAPTCQKVECNDPGSLRHGVRRPRKKKYYYKDKIRFRCKTNYTIIGRSAMACRSNGMWSGFKPACLAPCKDPGIPKGGVRLDHSFKHAQTVRFLCKKRNQPPSVSYLTCNNGRWNQNIPRCIADCDDPGTPINGQRQGTDFILKKRVYFTCDQGYMRVGPKYIQCQSNRRWSDKAPICEPLSCFRPIPPQNAYIYSRRQQKEKYGFNEVVMFYCNKGHFASGSPFVRCLANGWSKTTLRCPPKNCGDPGTPTNGRRQGNVFTFNNKVNFTCLDGYELEGPVERVCQENGTWSGTTTTTCERVECKDPGTPRNGIRRPENNKYVYEDRIDFMCNTSHYLRGNTSIICQSDRTWTGTVPVCLAPCRDPGIPIGGHRYQHSFLHNSIVRFSCNSGWTMDGSHTIRCTDGRWDHDSPTCNKACLRPNKYPVNGGIRGSYISYRHKYSISYYCYRGYNLVGRGNVRCLNGTWENKQPTCRPVECRDPGKLVNGGRYPDQNKYVFKNSIRFQCKTNYTLRGVPAITCQHDKRWSGNVPRCLAPCRDPGIPKNGHRLDHSFLHNARVRFSCRRGWNIEGSQTITCNNGNWDHTTPECMECGSALGMEDRKIPDGNIRASSTRYRYHAKDGRLNDRYAWCSGTARNPYLQIDFGKPYRITGLATQGSTYNNKWVENYTVTSNLAGSSFNIYREDGLDKIFIGNRDKGSVVKNKLRNPVIARRLRILPQKQGGFSGLSPACMRVEIYGCDLPSDCIQIGSRVVAKWTSNPRGGYKYLKAYLTSISRRYWRVELEDENHASPRHKYLLMYEDLPFVLDIPPKHEELQVGTRVLGAWGYRYFTGTIKTGKDRYNKYRVRADDGDEKDFTLDGIRVLKAPTFCN
ncbi:CUB and sushi domain-containing protein 3-like isoform X2 [Actinia tenebrosa]|uniref:CUB and sushi domain-containing protein 3-like isoform X2 n=1 Tax=Actinia tenebrosa TaxID=6105 RepID=A0A6P8HK16_ACTTE|nr:CUB and sushi domain-containing protein 3-like isoform X2 [Actinia tenebrosa]